MSSTEIFNPKPYQNIGIDWLTTKPHSCLFAGMGLGKTAMVLESFCRLQLLGLADAMLIIAPLRVCNMTWKHEILKWGNFSHLRYANLRTPEGLSAWRTRSADVYVINFEGLPKIMKLGLFKKPAADVLVIDELSKAKSPTSKRMNALLKERMKFARIWGLTGTPTPNSEMDLFAQIRLIDGGERLGKFVTHFREMYFRTSGFGGFKYEPKAFAKDAIQTKIADICLSMPSSKYLNIPDTHVEDVEVVLPNMAEYETFERTLVLQVREQTTGSDAQVECRSAVALITKLRQFTAGVIYDENKVIYDVHLSKIKALAKIAKQHDEPLLVAVHYKHEADLVRRSFPTATFFEDAKTPAQQDQLLSDWNSGKIKMLVANPQSMSHGLNMQHGGRIIVWLSLSYSLEQYDQMNARLARTGQEHVTVVYRILASGTIDDVIAEVLESKTTGQKGLLEALHMLYEKY